LNILPNLDEPLTLYELARNPVPSNQYLILETKGRRSGLPHIVQLRYARLGGTYYVLGRDSASDWVENALGLGSARVRLGEYLIDVAAALADEGEKAATVAAFQSKYGAGLFRRWYANAEVCLRLSPAGSAVRRGGGSGELGAKTSYRDWVSMGRNYYSEVATAFDSASEEYDFTIRRNYINTWIRRRSLDVLKLLVRPDDLLIEVGCGTGAEAMEVSDWVSTIIATDVSARMTELVRAKAKARGKEERVVPLNIRAAEVEKVAGMLGERRPRIAYSFNGALNCEPDLDAFVSQLHSLLDPGGYFVCSVRNTTCASEMISHALVLQFAKGTPRRLQPTMVSVGGVDIPSTYYSPSEFMSHFRPLFAPARVIGLPALMPPAYLSDYYLRLRGVSWLLERLEPLLSGIPPFNRLGDQTLFVFRNSPATAGPSA
jgi:SAM-dependent methyltransferase